MAMDLTRRVLLTGAFGLGLTAVAGCGGDISSVRTRFAYGHEPVQGGPLIIPATASGRTRDLVVLIHGGGWLAGFTPQAVALTQEALVKAGLAVWNIDYRAVGSGGGWPGTFEDIAAAADAVPRLLKRYDAFDESSRVVFVGHSAGAQLAVWAASRNAHTPGGAPTFKPDAVVSLAGPLLLQRGATEGGAQLAGLVKGLMGGLPGDVPDRYRLGDPGQLSPNAPIWVVTGAEDVIVPAWTGPDYVTAVAGAGGTSYLLPLPGAHGELVSPLALTWPAVLRTINQALRG